MPHPIQLLVSRRTLIKTAALSTLAAPIAGMSFEASAQSAVDAETLVIADALVDSWKTLDPAYFYEGNPTAAMYLIYDQLYHIPDGTNPRDIQPLLAADMPTVSGDGLTVTVPLRQDVTFQNTGNPMSAADVIFSFNRLKNIGYLGSFLAIDYWTDLQAEDDYSLKFTLPAPNGEFTALLTSVMLSVADRLAVIAAGGTDAPPSTDDENAPELLANLVAKEVLNKVSAGSGPFQVSQWDLNSEVHLDRFDGHWGTASPLKRVIWRNTSDLSAQFQSVQTGEVDIATSATPEQISGVDGVEMIALDGASMALQYLAYNLNPDRGGAATNPDVRVAIGHAIDYQGIIDRLLMGRALRPATVVPLPLEGTEAVLPDAFPTDPAKAQELWDSSGVGEAEIELLYGDGSGRGGVDFATLAAKLQSDMQQIEGLTIKLVPVPAAERSKRHREGDFELTIGNWIPDYPGVDSFTTPFFHTGGSAARRSSYSDPEMDAMVESGVASSDPAERESIYADIQRKAILEAPFTNLYQPDVVMIANKYVQDAFVHPAYSIQLRQTSKNG